MEKGLKCKKKKRKEKKSQTRPCKEKMNNIKFGLLIEGSSSFWLGEKVRARFGGEEPKVWFAFTPFCVGFFLIQVK